MNSNDTPKKEDGLSNFNNKNLTINESGMASMPSFNFMNTVASGYGQMNHSLRNDMPDFRQPASQVFMPEMPKSQPPLRRDRDNGLHPFDTRILNDNFQYHSDNSDEEGKGVGGKIEDSLFRPAFSVMVRHQDMYPPRSSSLLFQTNTENGGGINRLNMAAPRGHETMFDGHYRKMDFQHNNQY